MPKTHLRVCIKVCLNDSSRPTEALNNTRNDEAKGLGQHPLDKNGTAQNRQPYVQVEKWQVNSVHHHVTRNEMSNERTKKINNNIL
jgi:hypothetical protein